ncbi:hypothetical protein [Hymenobacter wooponensis]|nr:hypothetical protein [Hymenobacter wooponensis]
MPIPELAGRDEYEAVVGFGSCTATKQQDQEWKAHGELLVGKAG